MEWLYSRSGENQLQYDTLALGRYREYAKLLGRDTFSLLEVGCGSANMAWAFQRLGVRYAGIDIDAQVVQAAQQAGVENVRCISIFDLPVRERYDVVCASQVLEHIVRPVDFVEKVHGLLNEGGVLHLDIPSHQSLSAFAHAALPLSKVRFGAITLPHHQFAYEERTLERLLRERFQARVFSTNPDDPVWGQVGKFKLAHRAFYELCSTLNKNCMLVAFGRRT